MNKTKNKTKRYQKIKIEKLETAFSKLEQLESKPQSEFNLRESIYYLRNQLKSALKKGYSYEDLSDIIGRTGYFSFAGNSETTS